MGAVADSDPEVEWKRFTAVTEQLQQHSSPRVDVAAVQSALRQLQSPQQLCRLLGIQPVDPDGDANGGDANDTADGSEPDADWPERAATVAALVQQLLGLLLSGRQASRASAHQGIPHFRCGISPSRHNHTPHFHHQSNVCQSSYALRSSLGLSQTALQLLDLEAGGTELPSDISAAMVAARMIELLAIHAELRAAVSAVSGTAAPHNTGNSSQECCCQACTRRMACT